MRKTTITLLTLIALTAISTAAYLGYTTTQSTQPETIQAPITVPVTRGDVQRTVTAPGQLVGTNERVLAFTVSGRVTDLTIRPGSLVQAGDTLAQLDSAPFEDNLQRAQLAWDQAERAYEKQLADAQYALENNEALVNSTAAQTPALTAAQVQLNAAIDAEERAAYEYQKALDRTWEPPAVAEGYLREYEAQTAQRQIAQANYDAVLQQQWAVSQQVDALEAEAGRTALNLDYLEQNGPDPFLQLNLAQTEKELAATTLTAPFDGVVLDVLIRPGESVNSGQAIILLADPQSAEVRTTVIEEDLPLTQLNQPVELFFDAQPEIAIQGHVARIVPQRVEREERPLYHVYIALDDELPPTVYPGMTADAAIIINQTADTLRLPRALVNARSDGSATIEIWHNNQPTQRTIQTTLRGDAYVAIESGLQEGDQVIAE